MDKKHPRRMPKMRCVGLQHRLRCTAEIHRAKTKSTSFIRILLPGESTAGNSNLGVLLLLVLLLILLLLLLPLRLLLHRFHLSLCRHRFHLSLCRHLKRSRHQKIQSRNDSYRGGMQPATACRSTGGQIPPGLECLSRLHLVAASSRLALSPFLSAFSCPRLLLVLLPLLLPPFLAAFSFPQAKHLRRPWFCLQSLHTNTLRDRMLLAKADRGYHFLQRAHR